MTGTCTAGMLQMSVKDRASNSQHGHFILRIEMLGSAFHITALYTDLSTASPSSVACLGAEAYFTVTSRISALIPS